MSMAIKPFRWRQPSVLPGFGITLGLTLAYLSLMVLIPLSALFLKVAGTSWVSLGRTLSDDRVLASLRLSFGGALIAASINVLFGLPVAWMLTRYRLPGKRLIDALVDLPFALPTAVSGIALATIYGPQGWLGKPLKSLGIQAAYRPMGVILALTFIGLPFVVRTLQPTLEDLDLQCEEAAASLGASRFTALARIVLPSLWPSLLTGFALAFARAVGEYGSVIFISGGIRGRTEIAPMLIMEKLDQFDYAAATAIGAVMLLASFLLLLAINLLQWWTARRDRVEE